MPVALAAVAAVCFASAGVSMKRSFAGNSIVLVLLLALPVVVLITGVSIAFDPPDSLPWHSVAWFVAGGVVGDGVARVAYMSGVDRLGVARATPIQTASYPVLALFGGVVFFSETLTLVRVLGAVLIVAGIWAVVADEDESDAAERSGWRWRWDWAFLFPVVAGVAFATSDLFRKVGLEDAPSPALGATIGAATALTIWSVAVVASPRLRGQTSPGPAWQWSLLAGVFLAVGLISVFSALENGDISVVGPVIVSQPLAVVVLSALFLQEHEQVTWRTVLGAVLTVAGVVTLALGS